MGTNYYLRRAVRPSKLEEIKELVTQENIYNGTLEEALQELKPIHIGKHSAGWQFLFNHNHKKYYDTNKNSIAKFLEDEVNKGGELLNKYLEPISIKNFWELVNSDRDGFTMESYYWHELSRWKRYQTNPEEFKDDIFKPTHPDHLFTEFIEDGLRFSNSTEFC